MAKENKIDKKAAQLGWKHLVAAYRTSLGEGGEEAPYTKLDLYHRFLSSGTEEKGSYSYLFAEYGKEAGGKISFNFGEFILPEVLDLTFAANGSFQRRKVFLPMVHRTFAKRLGSYTYPNKTRWTSDKPISFLVFDGSYYIGQCGAELSAGVRAPTLNLDVIDIDVSVSASVSGNMSAHFFATKEDHPSSYISGMCEDLQKDFASVFGDEEVSIIEEFIKWYNKYLKDFLEEEDISAEAAELKKEIIKHILSSSKVRRVINFLKKDYLISLIKKFIESITKFIEENEIDISTVEKNELIKKGLDTFSKKIINTKKRGPVRPIQEGSFREGYCFFDLLSLNPSVKAQAGAKIEAKIGDAKAGVTGGISLPAEMKTVSSRFQNYNHSQHRGSILVMTQDTVIKYKQIKFTAEAKGIVKVPELKFEKSEEKNFEHMFLNKMSYHSATSLWMPDGNNKLQMGSGVSFGMSVRFGSLFEIAKGIKKGDDTENPVSELIDEYSINLKVEPSKLKSFVSALFSDDELNQDSKNVYPELMGDDAIYEYVLLEAAHIYTEPPLFTKNNYKESGNKRNSISDPIQGAGFKEILNSNSTYEHLEKKKLQLESIRVRIRIADNLGNPERNKIFSLGFIIRKIGIKLFLNSIKDFGNEGVFSMFTYFFENDVFKDKKGSEQKEKQIEKPGVARNTEERREQSVPPIFLPPHSSLLEEEEEEEEETEAEAEAE